MSHSIHHSKNPSDEYIEPKTKEQSKIKLTLDHKAAPLLKQKETKQRRSTAAAEAVDFFKENIEDIQPHIINDLIKWTNVIGEPLVLAAMKRALERGKGKGNWGYIKGILQAWSDKGFTSVKETEDEVVEFRNKQNRQAWRTSETRNQEVVPDWFHERNKKRDQRIETVVEAKEREELKKLVAEYASG